MSLSLLGFKKDKNLINDFIFEDTREAFNNMNQGYFYDHEKMSDNYQEMMLCRGPDSNIAKKINYLIGIS